MNYAQIEKCNHKIIAKLLNESMSILWLKEVKHKNNFFFLIDAVSYIVKSVVAINVFYSKMIYLTCLAHGFNRIGETIRAKFSTLDQLIADVKKYI